MGNLLVTGGNGAGKTCYTVAKLMREQIGREIEYEDAFEIKHKAVRRIVAAGFRKLLVEHERIPHPLIDRPEDCWTSADVERWNRLSAEGFPVMERRPFEPPVLTEVVNGVERPLIPCLFNWWLWVMPGDYVFIDEMQFVVPRGLMGRVAPLWMRKIEIHRHYGMDWGWITPHPQLLDMNLRKLATEHRHVRAVRFFPRVAMVYVWDHESNVDRIIQATKEKFVKRAEYFKLYKSTAAVMKQATPGRSLFLIAPIALAASIGMGWYAVSKAAKPSARATAVAAAMVSKPASASVGRPVPLKGWIDVPKLTGCYTVGPSCRCIGEQSQPVLVELAMCRTSAAGFDGLLRPEPRSLPVDTARYGASAGPLQSRVEGVPAKPGEQSSTGTGRSPV